MPFQFEHLFCFSVDGNIVHGNSLKWFIGSVQEDTVFRNFEKRILKFLMSFLFLKSISKIKFLAGSIPGSA